MGFRSDYRKNSFVTVLTADMGIYDSYCLAEMTSHFPDSGHLRIGGEYIYYDGKTPGSFDILTRGLRGSIRKKHKTGDLVIYTEPFNPASDALDTATSWIKNDLYVDEDGDLYIGKDGDIKIAEGLEALDIALRIRMTSLLGKGVGVGTGVDLTGKTNADIKVIIGSLVDSILAHPAVSKVSDITYEYNDYSLSISMQVYVNGLSQGFKFYYKINYKDGF